MNGQATDGRTGTGAGAKAAADGGTGTRADTAADARTGAGADAGTGRDAIVRAARRAFAFRPYAEVTMRGIAADAGVSASLIVKYFGTKEGLFNTIADFGPAADQLFAAPLDTLGRHLVLTLVGSRRDQRGDPLLRVVFSLGNDDERTLLRERFGEQITQRLTGLLSGRDRELRAELIAGQLLGLGATLSLHRAGAGARATPERLADLYAPALQRLVTG
ncbi:TetR family transcriptional regulator [Streptomyces sp. NPDC051569]|uniref:TetR/AcrR family transcriptional regulator n=1 Tax=Streptomyces sp. NPDC051569 TaxID=3365661 RepID=UPI0037B8D6F3